jgi:hypothetical protein
VTSFSDRSSSLSDRTAATPPPPPDDGPHPELPPTSTTATVTSGLELPPLDTTVRIPSGGLRAAPIDTPKVDTGGPQSPDTGTTGTISDKAPLAPTGGNTAEAADPLLKQQISGEVWLGGRGAAVFPSLVHDGEISADFVVDSGRGANVPWSDLGP